jgi:hypothetical protein
MWSLGASLVGVALLAAGEAPEQPQWREVVIAVVLILCIVGVTLTPTKRTHRD